MILDRILKNKKQELSELEKTRPLDMIKDKLSGLPPARDFKKALRLSLVNGKEKPIRIIAEVKKASPSKGVIREDFNPVEIATIYQESGAAAISVLTDKMFFQGDIEYLKEIKDSTSIPILNKDFIITPYQIYMARLYGADAVLLIAAILSDYELKTFIALTSQLGLDALVEVHTRAELKRVLATDAKIIGINNRNLKSFQVCTETSSQLVKDIPDNVVTVSESGIDCKMIIMSLQREGIDAFLIGEALMKEKDIGCTLRALIN
jgi:indole-3-glycerol phosphate synthase